MPSVNIPQDLFQQIDQSGPQSLSATEFVAQAVREKLDRERRLDRLDELTATIRQSMIERGLTEEDVIADFESHRRLANK